ncbi:MAG: hypothetical protein LBU42_01525 [Prevotellaceae bacterium]|jgi:hypothetical protein|nr:hypothetical protein [Prevotellaceae bacterium]
MNSDKIILDLCGGTGAWSKPYRDAGYEVHLLTLPEYNVVEIGYSEKDLYICPKSSHYFTIPFRAIYGILAAPPCTEFSLAKGSLPRDFKAAMQVVRACMEVIWHCRTFGKIKFWAMENPRGFLRQFMGKPAFVFEQWQYGTNTVKATDIWGYFNTPNPTVKTRPDNITTCIRHRSNGRDWTKPVIPNEYKQLDLDRAAARAITPAGFAQAFFKANK